MCSLEEQGLGFESALSACGQGAGFNNGICRTSPFPPPQLLKGKQYPREPKLNSPILHYSAIKVP